MSLISVSLFDRSRRQLIPTSIGRRYYEEAIAALKNLTQLEASIKTGKNEVHGILKVRATRYHAMTEILPRLKAFLHQYPKLQLKLEIHEILPDLIKEEVDIVYGPSMQGEASWIQKKIGEVRYVLCATPAYFQKAGIPKTRAELSQHRYLTHMGRQPDSLVRFADQEFTLAPYLWFNSYEGLFAAALQDLGLIWVHENPAWEYLASGQFLEIFAEHSLRHQATYLYYQNDQYLDPKIRAFVDFFAA